MKYHSIGRFVATVVASSCLAACGSGSAPNSLPSISSGSSPAAVGKKSAFVVHLTPQHTVVVVNATSVAASGNSVTIQYDSGVTNTLIGEAPRVDQTQLTYEGTQPGGGAQVPTRTSCLNPPFFRYFDQAYKFEEINNAPGADYYYDLFYHAPAYDNFVPGSEMDYWYGQYASGGSFSYTFGPTYFNPGYSSGIPSGQIDFDGGPTHEYITSTTVKIVFTDNVGNTWDAYGSKIPSCHPV